MNIFKDIEVQKYLSSFGQMNPLYGDAVMLDCRCIFESVPNNSHSTIATPVSPHLAELAANQGSKHLKSVVIYLNKTSYLNSHTMTLLLDKMLQCSEIETVERYYSILDANYITHPPCAPYMKTEYEKLMLTTFRRCFKEMTLWCFLVDSFSQMTDGSLSYGENKVRDYGFKRCLNFCVRILQIDFEISKINNSKPLIMKCLNYNPERKTRLSDVTKLLDKVYNTGYDFQVLIIDLAHLINQIK